MTEFDTLAASFETHRPRLRGLAYRMLGSLSEADDAVQESWLRLSRSDRDDLHNLPGWLTTVVSRVCLDLLRSRASRREDLVARPEPDDHPDARRGGDPEQEALLLDEVGRALLVVLDRLAPAERIAFVLHDMFAVPFNEIAPVLDRTPATTKRLASRARVRVRGTPAVTTAQLRQHRQVVESFLAASRAGDVQAVVAMLDPDVVRRADRAAIPAGRPTEVRGASAVAEEIAVFGGRARFAVPVLLDGDVGIVVAPHGRLQLALTVTITHGKITSYQLIADPVNLAPLDLAILDT